MLKNKTEDLSDVAIKEQSIEKWCLLCGCEKVDNKWIAPDGEVLGNDLWNVFTQVLVRSHELVRVRQDIWGSDKSDKEKLVLIAILNLSTQLIHYLLTIGNNTQAYDAAERLKIAVNWFFGDYSMDDWNNPVD